MIKLVNLLTEIQWLTKISEKIHKNDIPLTPAMINRVFGKKIIRALHTTDISNF
jgi:hypothetical protein